MDSGKIAYVGRMEFTLCNISRGEMRPSMTILKTVPRVAIEAIKRLEEKIACAADVQQVAVN